MVSQSTFFLDFFDILGINLVEVVNESRIKGMVFGALNVTFISLILKVENPNTFSVFRLISLCNLVYKLISKIIANRMKPIMSRWMSTE